MDGIIDTYVLTFPVIQKVLLSVLNYLKTLKYNLPV